MYDLVEIILEKILVRIENIKVINRMREIIIYTIAQFIFSK